MALREIGPALGACARVVRAATVAPRTEAGLALVEAPPLLARDEPMSVRVRLVNPTRAECRLQVAVDGIAADGRTFHVSWNAHLAPFAAEDRYVVTTWRGDATVEQTEPSLPHRWAVGVPAATWRVIARVGSCPPLEVAGAWTS